MRPRCYWDLNVCFQNEKCSKKGLPCFLKQRQGMYPHSKGASGLQPSAMLIPAHMSFTTVNRVLDSFCQFFSIFLVFFLSSDGPTNWEGGCLKQTKPKVWLLQASSKSCFGSSVGANFSCQTPVLLQFQFRRKIPLAEPQQSQPDSALCKRVPQKNRPPKAPQPDADWHLLFSGDRELTFYLISPSLVNWAV